MEKQIKTTPTREGTFGFCEGPRFIEDKSWTAISEAGQKPSNLNEKDSNRYDKILQHYYNLHKDLITDNILYLFPENKQCQINAADKSDLFEPREDNDEIWDDEKCNEAIQNNQYKPYYVNETIMHFIQKEKILKG